MTRVHQRRHFCILKGYCGNWIFWISFNMIFEEGLLDQLCIHGSKERTGQNKSPLLLSWILESGREGPWHFSVAPSHNAVASSVKKGVAVSRRSLSGVRNIDTYRSCSPSAANRITKISPFVNTRPGYPHYSHIRSQRVYQIVVMPPCVETRSSSQYIEYLRPGNQVLATHEGTIFCLSKPCQVCPRFDSVSCQYQGRG